MKVTKALKTLKFWSKKKKKKKINNIHHNSPPPPPCCCYFHHHHHHDGSQTVPPSAPPLPSWLDYEDPTSNQQHLLAIEVNFDELGLPVSYEAQIDQREDEIGKVNRSCGDLESGCCSYQQYMVENPVYEAGVLPARKTERSGGGVGCVFNIGVHLFRCFFPCFHVREV